MKYLKKNYKLLKFERSTRKGKKYDAVLEHKTTGKIVRVAFGAEKMQQYRDATPLKLYKSQDHLDETRRKAFRNRFRRLINNKDYRAYFSPIWFSTEYLW
jgi:hypothetical protein